MTKSFLFILLFCTAVQASGQVLTGASARWSDSFREWIIYTEDYNDEGDLHLRWENGDALSEWDYYFADVSGAIKIKWPKDPSEWEIRSSEGEIVSAKALWNNSFREWRISNNDIQITLTCRYNSTWDEWEVHGNYGNLSIYTAYEGDPRDWVVIDELDEDVPSAMRMAILFVVLYHSSPRF